MLSSSRARWASLAAGCGVTCAPPCALTQRFSTEDVQGGALSNGAAARDGARRMGSSWWRKVAICSTVRLWRLRPSAVSTVAPRGAVSSRRPCAVSSTARRPGNAVFGAGKRPAHPYKHTTQNRFTTKNAKAA
jgi:hypothetical protein